MRRATPVVVTTGRTRTHIDAALRTGGAITGTTSYAGQPVFGVFVSVYTSVGRLVTTVGSDAAGQYRIPSLNPGRKYLVCFDTAFVPAGTPPTGYADQCFKDQPADG